MNRNKIDKILNEINQSSNYTSLFEDDFNNYADYVEYKSLLVLMIEDTKLIKKPISNNAILYLTKFGNEVINQGGWVKYLENEKLKSENENEKQIAEIESLKTSTKVNKFLLKTKWLPHIVSLLTLLFSIFAYVKANNDQKILELKIIKLEQIIKDNKSETQK